MCVDVGEDFDCADNGVGGGRNTVGSLNDPAEGAANIAIAFRVQAGGARVAINCAAISVVILGYLTDALPADKGLVYFVLILVATDFAVRLMEFEARQALGRRGIFFFLGCDFFRSLEFDLRAATSIVAALAAERSSPLSRMRSITLATVGEIAAISLAASRQLIVASLLGVGGAVAGSAASARPEGGAAIATGAIGLSANGAPSVPDARAGRDWSNARAMLWVFRGRGENRQCGR